MTIIFYIVTPLVEFFALSTLISFPLTMLITAIFRKAMFAQAFSTIIIYHLYNYIWRNIEGGNIPILMMGILLIQTKLQSSSQSLNDAGRMTTFGTLWGQLVFTITLIFYSGSLRWI